MVNIKISQLGCQLNPGSRDLGRQRADQRQAEVSADTVIQSLLDLQTNRIARTKITQVVEDCIGLSEEAYSGCITWLDRAIYSYQTSPFIVGSKSQKKTETLLSFSLEGLRNLLQNHGSRFSIRVRMECVL
jgi:hypothetical protein